MLRDVRDERQAKQQAQERERRKDEQLLQNTTEYEKRITSLRQGYENQLVRKDTDYTNHIKQLELSWAQTERNLRQQHEVEKLRLQKENGELKQDLYGKGEQGKGLTDRELITRFKRLSTEIEEFSRIEWDDTQEEQWPLSEDALRNIHPRNVRRLKQEILHNCLWHSLHEFVFSTPFRIIGEYGQIYDSTSYEAYSSGMF